MVRKLGFFEKYLTVWVFACIGIGILLGKIFPSMGSTLDKVSVAEVSIPIAICLFFMMYPIMVKIDFAEVIKAGKTPKPVLLTLFVNWCIKPFTMVAIATFFLGFVFKGALGGDATLDTASTYIVPATGQAAPLYRSNISGCILRGGPGHGRRGAHRGAGDAPAGEDLPEDAALVQDRG